MKTILEYSQKETPWFDGKLWHVCAWCWPGQSVSKIWPEVDLAKTTHGQCKHHQDTMLAELLQLDNGRKAAKV